MHDFRIFDKIAAKSIKNNHGECRGRQHGGLGHPKPSPKAPKMIPGSSKMKPRVPSWASRVPQWLPRRAMAVQLAAPSAPESKFERPWKSLGLIWEAPRFLFGRIVRQSGTNDFIPFQSIQCATFHSVPGVSGKRPWSIRGPRSQIALHHPRKLPD